MTCAGSRRPRQTLHAPCMSDGQRWRRTKWSCIAFLRWQIDDDCQGDPLATILVAVVRSIAAKQQRRSQLIKPNRLRSGLTCYSVITDTPFHVRSRVVSLSHLPILTARPSPPASGHLSQLNESRTGTEDRQSLLGESTLLVARPCWRSLMGSIHT